MSVVRVRFKKDGELKKTEFFFSSSKEALRESCVKYLEFKKLDVDRADYEQVKILGEDSVPVEDGLKGYFVFR